MAEASAQNPLSIDNHVFETKNECKKYDPENCSSVDRLVWCLKYFNSLKNVTDDKNNQMEFVDFMENKYTNYLNDIIHLINSHEQHLENINKLLFTKYGFKRCDITLCLFSDRHSKVTEPQNSDTDPIFRFYQNTLDSVHYYIFHLFDLGLRTLTNDYCNQQMNSTQQQDLSTCFDTAFSSKKKNIHNKKKHLRQFFKRFQTEYNKFTIQTDLNIKEDNNVCDKTFLDTFYNEINSIWLRSYLLQEEYDSDALEEDLVENNFNETSNICLHMKDKKLNKQICRYVKTHRLQNMAFSTGFVFWYWKYYAQKENVQMKQNDKPIYGNDNDFGGYSISDLYIKQGKHDNFKAEILQYSDNKNGNFSIEIYNNRIMFKTLQYMNTSKVKNIKPKKPHQNAMRYYGIECPKYGHNDDKYQCISASHIMALILYCDFSELCTLFSSSFRRLNPSESLEEVKERNRKYWWMSKLLREAVEIYGVNAHEHWDGYHMKFIDGEIGPFF
eukprot:346963_1